MYTLDGPSFKFPDDTDLAHDFILIHGRVQNVGITHTGHIGQKHIPNDEGRSLVSKGRTP